MPCTGTKYPVLKILAVLILFGPWLLTAQVGFGYQSVFKYLKGNEASELPAGWMHPSFDDSGWNSGNAPFRYGDGSGGTVLSDMAQSHEGRIDRLEVDPLHTAEEIEPEVVE